MIKVGIFVSAGLGNALLQIPMLKYLKSKNYHITGFFTSAFNCEELFEKSDWYDERIILTSSVIKSAGVVTKQLQSLDVVYLDYFSATKKNILIAKALAKKIVTNRPENLVPKALQANLMFCSSVENIHEGLQNLKLVGSDKTTLSEQDFYLFDNESSNIRNQSKFLLPEKYIAVQISAGNNNTPYKVWPENSWRVFLEKMTSKGFTFVLMGDNTEIELSKTISKNLTNVVNLTGKTSINDCIQLVDNCSFYLGLDSGLMHLAVALGKPTFTLWGGSDYRMYGYHTIDPNRHFITYQKMPCWPCNSYLNPNITRVNDPLKCPNYECISTISVEKVVGDFERFIKTIEFDK